MSEQFNLADQHNLFKINYYKKSENMYNSDNVLSGRIKKVYNFTGKQKFVATPLSFSGGVGSGKLPKSNNGKYEGAVITAKRCYATCEIERESIYASKDDKGAFVRATKEVVKKAVESYMRNGSRILFGDGSGILGRIDAAALVVSAGSAHTITISEASFLEANWEEMDYVQVVSGMNALPDNAVGAPEGGQTETNLLEITDVNPDTREITLDGTSPTLNARNGLVIGSLVGVCMQKSFGVEPQGIKGIFEASLSASGSLYNIPVQRRWQSYLKDAGGAGVSTSLLNHVMLKTRIKSGKAPTMIMTNEDQYQNIIDLMEDQKIYNLPNKNLKAHMGFEGVEYVGAGGKKIGIFIDRFADSDKVYFLNDSRIESHHRPGFGWFDDDGTVFLRLQDDDAYGARYGGYLDHFIIPTGHGFLYNLAV
mgnify:CR=1 FL=1|tara:strand:- start:902 stop:2170 length:1269 start_codon:yes stop_codon:yes gene_type:complete